MRYVSTRGGAAPVSLSGAIIAGLASDGGLFVPEAVPQLAASSFDGVDTFQKRAIAVLAPFFAGDELERALPAIVTEAFSFDAPLRETRQAGVFSLELFHGPTAAFKDFGARFLAACMTRLHRGAAPLTILVATSGDTGAAVAAAFHKRPGVRVIILYPDGLVSARQAHQLGAFGDNVSALRVAGRFDDCQRLVKQAFADDTLAERMSLSSANSINIGRLLPQMSYYTNAALSYRAQRGEALNFIIPSGNLGNAFACVLARAAGAPVGEVVLATNANHTIADYFRGDDYRGRPSVATLANAMDVGDPSNFERFKWLFGDRLRDAVSAATSDDEAIQLRIREGEQRYGMVWCPHTACAVDALEQRRKAGDTRDWCVVATAHPSKFEDVVEPLVGHDVAPPPELAAMLARPSTAEPIAADYAAFRARLLSAS
jgi:threonine synthase